jgi:hypothetical protein
MAVNGGLMPVTPEKLQMVSEAHGETFQLGQTPPQSKNVLLAPSDTKLSYLSDTIYFSIPKPKVYSIGDLLLVFGIAIFLMEVAVRVIRSRRRPKITHLALEA